MNPSEKYWLTRLESCAKALTKNGFSAIVVDRIEDAANAAAEIIEKLAPRTIGYADSRTMHRSGILNVIRQDDRRTLIDGFDPSKERAENLLTRRQALLSDLFLTGANAVTEKGELVWLDMIGKRIAAVQDPRRPDERPRSCDIQNALPDDRPVSRLQQSRPDLQRLVDPRKVFSERADRRHPDQRGSGLLANRRLHLLTGIIHGPVQQSDERHRRAELAGNAFDQIRLQHKTVVDELFQIDVLQFQVFDIRTVGRKTGRFSAFNEKPDAPRTAAAKRSPLSKISSRTLFNTFGSGIYNPAESR